MAGSARVLAIKPCGCLPGRLRMVCQGGVLTLELRHGQEVELPGCLVNQKNDSKPALEKPRKKRGLVGKQNKKPREQKAWLGSQALGGITKAKGLLQLQPCKAHRRGHFARNPVCRPPRAKASGSGHVGFLPPPFFFSVLRSPAKSESLSVGDIRPPN